MGPGFKVGNEIASKERVILPERSFEPVYIRVS